MTIYKFKWRTTCPQVAQWFPHHFVLVKKNNPQDYDLMKKMPPYILQMIKMTANTISMPTSDPVLAHEIELFKLICTPEEANLWLQWTLSKQGPDFVRFMIECVLSRLREEIQCNKNIYKPNYNNNEKKNQDN